MSEPLIAIVDENDELIEPAKKIDAINHRLIRRLVHVYLQNDEGKFLFQWRGAHKRGPHLFDASVGGHVDAGETYEIAAQREMKEELGVEPSLKNIGKDFCDEDTAFTGIYFAKHNGPFTNWEEEADALEWMTIDEAQYLMKRMPYIFAANSIGTFQLLLNTLEGEK